MPAQRPTASFDPISPDLNLASLVEETPNFEYVVRISYDMIEHQGVEAFDRLVLLHVIMGGKPLVIEGLQHRLDEWTFSSQWLQDNQGKKFEQARNLTTKQNMALSIGHYLSNLSKLTNQWNVHNYKELDRQRIYLKDIDCPEVWHEKLKGQIPASVFYLNESTGDVGGPGSNYEANPAGPGTRKCRGVARAGDLMSCLPPNMRADNLMCYIGHEGTYTPAHREMCASLGQNLMVEASGTLDGDGKPVKPGSSIWFMTETKDRHLVSEYWLSTLGHDIEVEAHFAQINAWKAAPFKTYVVEQKVGDFILIPPLAPHQVWNRGTRTMKVAWNRTTVETLEMALDEALPRARLVCRDEQYKNKAMVMFALEKYSGLLEHVDQQKQTTTESGLLQELNNSPKIRQLQKDFRRLFSLYTQILLSEMLSTVSPNEKRGQYLPYDSYITCSYCRCNIFNRFLTCTSCVVPLENGDEDTYDICMDCFAMGRSCRCLSGYKWVEQFPWQELVQKHERWRNQIIGFDHGATKKSPLALHTERENTSKKTLAQVCQEQLKARPWLDPKKEASRELAIELVDEDQLSGDNLLSRNERRTKRRRKERARKDTICCHISHEPERLWKIAMCKCGRGYSYGCMFRAFDQMPLSIMENPDWQCPHCLKICSCAQCRKVKGVRPYEPSGTMLGHDTKKVADPRSVESLVNFSVSNISWIKKVGDDDPYESNRLRRRRDEATKDKSKDPALNDHYVGEEEQTPKSHQHHDSGIPIDPSLSINQLSVPPISQPQQIVIPSENRWSNASGTLPPHENRRTSGRKRNHAITDNPDQAGGSSDDEISDDRTRAERSGSSLDEDHAHAGPQPGFSPSGMPMDPTPHYGTFTTKDTGITYQYPDPTLSEYGNVPQIDQYQQPLPQHDQQLQQGTKRKWSDSRNLLQSDLIITSKNDLISPGQNHLATANEQYRDARTKQNLEEARRAGRYISALAAINGQSLVVRLRLNSLLLAKINGQNGLAHRNPSTYEASAPVDHMMENIIVQSDLPSVSVLKSEKMAKRKRVRLEQDEDFSTCRISHRAPTSPRMSLPDVLRKTSATYLATSSDSEDSDQYDSHQPTPIQVVKKPRQLPAYLARKAQEEVTPPTDMSEIQRRRRKKIDAVEEQHSKDSNGVSPRQADTLSAYAPIFTAVNSSPIIGTAIGTSADADPNINPSSIGPGITARPSTATRELEDDRQAAAKQAEENRKAKLKALLWADDNSNDDDSSSGSSSNKHEVDEFEKLVRASHLPANKRQRSAGNSREASVRKVLKAPETSRFDKTGIEGKKIKIKSTKATTGKEKPLTSENTTRQSLP